MSESARTTEQIVEAQQRRANDRREAMQILHGESTLFIEKRHLLAVARDAALAEARTAQLGQVLGAIVHDSGEASLRIDGALLQHVRETPILVALHPQEDGSMVVEKVMPTVKPSASVN